jgi:hypothetical protein
LITLIIFCEVYKLRSSSLWTLLQPPATSFILCPIFSAPFDYPNNICWRVQVMMLFITQFSLASYHISSSIFSWKWSLVTTLSCNTVIPVQFINFINSIYYCTVMISALISSKTETCISNNWISQPMWYAKSQRTDSC